MLNNIKILDKINTLSLLIIKKKGLSGYIKRSHISSTMKDSTDLLGKTLIIIDKAKLYRDNIKSTDFSIKEDFLTSNEIVNNFMFHYYFDYYVLDSKINMLLNNYPRKLKKIDLIDLNTIYKKYKK